MYLPLYPHYRLLPVSPYCGNLNSHLLQASIGKKTELTSNTKLAAISRATSSNSMLNYFCPEIESNVQFDRTRDFIERTQFDRTANGCNKENRKKPVRNHQKTAQFSQFDALKYPLWLW